MDGIPVKELNLSTLAWSLTYTVVAGTLLNIFTPLSSWLKSKELKSISFNILSFSNKVSAFVIAFGTSKAITYDSFQEENKVAENVQEVAIDTKKDKKTHPDRMETKKYCRFCKRHTLHKETK